MATYSIRQISDRIKLGLNPCAICDTTKYLQMVMPDSGTFQVKCMGCCSAGPIMASKSAAFEGWNK